MSAPVRPTSDWTMASQASPARGRAGDADAPDWSRERKHWWHWAPSRSLLASIRAWQRHAARRGPLHRALRSWAVLRHRFWSVVCSAEIPPETQLGGGLWMPHPNGIVIHPQAVVGPNCLLMQQVTLGTRGRSDGLPRLGAWVDVGAGAKILGGVTIGDRARIGANAVVLDDVPAGALAVGVPARIVPQ
jgi:serine O-acetyltransferase